MEFHQEFLIIRYFILFFISHSNKYCFFHRCMYPIFVFFWYFEFAFIWFFFQMINDAMITTVLTHVSDTNVCLPAPTHVLATPTQHPPSVRIWFVTFPFGQKYVDFLCQSVRTGCSCIQSSERDIWN